MEFVLMYCTIWVEAVVWFIIFSILSMEVARNLGFGLLFCRGCVEAAGHWRDE